MTTDLPAYVGFPNERISLAGTWKFMEDPENKGLTRQWHEETDDSSWALVSVPGTWGWEKESYRYYGGYGWYRTQFFARHEWANRFVSLSFGAVHHSADIWIHGAHVGSHEGGFTPFDFDVSEHLHHGANNLLVVRVSNHLSNSTIPPANATDSVGLYGGIHRGVYLQVSDSPAIRRALVSSDYTAGARECSINVDVSIINRSDSPKSIEVEMVFTSPDGTTESAGMYHIDALQGVSEHSFRHPVSNPQLWWSCDIGKPNLYLLTASLIHDGKTVDSMTTRFGIRDIAVHPDGLYLNGVKLFLKGVNRHEYQPGLGWTEDERIIEDDFNSIRELHANFVRLAHYPQDERVLEYCDAHGVLVYEEIPAYQCRPSTLEDPSAIASSIAQLTDLIVRDYNHPSVILWGLGNEFSSDTEEGRNFISTLYAHVKSIDSTRPVTFATDKRTSDKGLDLVDIIAINEYFGLLYDETADLSDVLDALHHAYPDKPILITEFGSNAASMPDRAAYIQDHWRIIRGKDFVIGGAVWVYNEYIWREPDLDTWGIDEFGIVDQKRNPKPICYAAIREMFAIS